MGFRLKRWVCQNRSCPRFDPDNPCATFSPDRPANDPCGTGSTPEKFQGHEWEERGYL